MTDLNVPANTALIIVDVQNDFCPGGNLAVEEGDQIIPLVNDLRKNFDMVIVTQDWHPEGHSSFASSHEGKEPLDTVEMPYGTQVLWPDHCVQNTDGAEFHKDLDLSACDLLLQKGTDPDIDSYSGFFENDGQTRPRFEDDKTLAETLREHGITRVVLAGLAYDFCVGWHALDARNEGFDAIVVKDATRPIAAPSPDGGPNTEEAMTAQMQQAGVKIVNAEDLPQILDQNYSVHPQAPRASGPGPF